MKKMIELNQAEVNAIGGGNIKDTFSAVNNKIKDAMHDIASFASGFEHGFIGGVVCTLGVVWGLKRVFRPIRNVVHLPAPAPAALGLE